MKIFTGKNQSILSLLFLTATQTPTLVHSEIRTFNGEIEAASNYIHFSEGYLVTPGYVDLSGLTFTVTDEESDYEYHDRVDDDGIVNDDDEADDDDEVEEKGEDKGEGAVGEEEGEEDRQGDDAVVEEDDDDEVVEENEEILADDVVMTDDEIKKELGDGGDRAMRYLDGTSTFIDVVFFHEPPECSNTKAGCDWNKLGVGKSDKEGNLRWCCSDDAIELGLCDGSENHYGRLIINEKKFKGEHRFLTVPASGEMEATIKYGKIEQKKHTGKYVLIMANCNDHGRNVMVNGKYEWKSKHGYLPGNLFGELYFFVSLSIVYFLLVLWYGISMKCNEESVIPIQKWILVTIMFGLVEFFFKGGDFFIWNEDGYRAWFALYIGITLGVFKRAISRCLVVMVSLGWGVVRDSLGEQMKKIIALGCIYVGCSAARDIMTVFAITENQVLSIDEEEELFDAVTILTFVVAAIDVTFYMWILDALNGTMQYLENMNQNMKLQRYLKLRCILLFSILFAVVWAIFGIVNNLMDNQMMEENNEWIIDATWDLNYLVVLIAIAVLWKPDPKAKEYAYVMELPTVGNDVEFETNADIIQGPDSYADEPEGETGENLKIEGAVDA